MKFRVLFLCATNSVQSPMAEALLRGLDSANFEAHSAGIERGETHPLTTEVMKEIGVDLQGRVAKSTQDLAPLRFDFVITLCDRAKSACPGFPDAEVVHWQFDDPLVILDQAKQRRSFQSLRDQIAQRLRLFALVQVRFAEVAANAGRRRHVESDLVHS